MSELKVKALGALYPVLRSKRPGVLMWHHGRCGSTVVGKLLNQHPDVSWRGEIFEQYAVARVQRPNFREDLKYVQVTARGKSAGIEIKGLPSQHLQRLGVALPEFVDVVRAYGFTQCVYLHRRNTLRKLISVQIVEQGLRESFHQDAGAAGDALRGQLHVDVQSVRIQGKQAPLLDMLEYIDDEAQRALVILEKAFDVLALYYEDDVQDDPLVAYAKVCSHVGLAPHEASVSMKRINSQSLRDLVANAAEIEDHLAGTPYEWMLTS